MPCCTVSAAPSYLPGEGLRWARGGRATLCAWPGCCGSWTRVPGTVWGGVQGVAGGPSAGVSADFFQVSWGLVHWPDGRQVCPLGHGSQGSMWADAALHPQLGACVPPPGCSGQRHLEGTMVSPAGWGSLNDWMGGASELLSSKPVLGRVCLKHPLTLISAWMSAF